VRRAGHGYCGQSAADQRIVGQSRKATPFARGKSLAKRAVSLKLGAVKAFVSPFCPVLTPVLDASQLAVLPLVNCPAPCSSVPRGQPFDMMKPEARCRERSMLTPRLFVVGSVLIDPAAAGPAACDPT